MSEGNQWENHLADENHLWLSCRYRRIDLVPCSSWQTNAETMEKREEQRSAWCTEIEEEPKQVWCVNEAVLFFFLICNREYWMVALDDGFCQWQIFGDASHFRPLIYVKVWLWMYNIIHGTQILEPFLQSSVITRHGNGFLWPLVVFPLSIWSCYYRRLKITFYMNHFQIFLINFIKKL